MYKEEDADSVNIGWLETVKELYDEQVAEENQVECERIIRVLRDRGFDDLATDLETSLASESWYCDVCHGTHEITEGEADNLITKKCICQK